MSDRFVTAFAGRRDGYQIPFALAEGGLLARFVTTFYLTLRRERLLRAAFRRIPGAASLRRITGIDDGLVRSLIIPEMVEQVGRRVGVSPRRYWGFIDRAISRAAGDEAARARADLILYEPYALPAFTRSYVGFQPRKILFHFHPHPALEAEIYAEDLRQQPPKAPWFCADGGGHAADGDDARHAWKHADLILCASSFTKRSLVHAGADPARCRVIPYGVDSAPELPSRAYDQKFRALFVGSGIQRKGLHHLLAAWQMARLPADSELTLVCRTIDPQMRERMTSVPRCRLIAGMNQRELSEAYSSASVLVVPSLVEGFGQVYLEALAHGCPVLGTANTGLPDLGGEADGLFLVEPGNVTDLAAKLEHLAQRNALDESLSRAAWQVARKFSWSRFRAGLLEAVA